MTSETSKLRSYGRTAVPLVPSARGLAQYRRCTSSSRPNMATQVGHSASRSRPVARPRLHVDTCEAASLVVDRDLAIKRNRVGVDTDAVADELPSTHFVGSGVLLDKQAQLWADADCEGLARSGRHKTSVTQAAA